MRTAAIEHPPPTSAGGGPAAGEGSVVSQLCRAAMLIAVCRSLYTSGGYPLCICCHKQFYFGGAPGDDDTQNANADGGEIMMLTMLDSPCAGEMTCSVVAAITVLLTVFPFRGVGALLKRFLTLVFPLRLLRVGSVLSADEGEEEAVDRRPIMSAALEAVVTDEDVAQFLSDLAHAPTEVEAEEATAAAAEARRRPSSDEVMSGVGGVAARGLAVGGEGDGGGAEAGIFRRNGEEGGPWVPSGAAAAGDVEGGEWSVIHRGSTGTGTTYRMLRRNGPAPGTTDGGERGLAQFRLEAVMEGVTAARLARVQMNDLVRAQWDTSLLHGDQLAISEPKTTSATSSASSVSASSPTDNTDDGSELAFWRMKFPMPMAPRDYLFVRRRWQTEDGAFYGVTRDATGMAGGAADALAASININGGGYRVRRLYSGQRIRSVIITPGAGAGGASAAAAGGGGGGGGGGALEGDQQQQQQSPRPSSSSTSSTTTTTGGGSHNSLASGSTLGAGFTGASGPAAELVSIYHEDSGVPAAVIALAACKGLLPFMRSLEAAARGSLGIEGGEKAVGSRSGARAALSGGGHISGRLRRRIFGAKDGSTRRSLRGMMTMRGMTGWSSRLSRFSQSAMTRRLGDADAGQTPKAGFSGENAVRVERFGFRQGTRRVLSKLKDGIHRTVHKTSAAHENIHAEGRRRKLMVRAAGLVAMMAHVKKNRS